MYAGLIAATEVIQTLWLGCGDVKSLCCDHVMGAGAVAESGDVWAFRRSSVPSSVALTGVGMSLMGSSILMSEGLECESGGVRARGGDSRSVGGGVGSCAGASSVGSSSFASRSCCPMEGECDA